MKSKLIILMAALALSGCTKTQYGKLLIEDGEVVDTCYMPPGHGEGSGVGITTGGDVAITSDSVDIPARYAVVFKCQHGKFAIDGECGQELYSRLQKGDKVKIEYCEKFEVDGNETNFVGFHFETAIKTPCKTKGAER